MISTQSLNNANLVRRINMRKDSHVLRKFVYISYFPSLNLIKIGVGNYRRVREIVKKSFLIGLWNVEKSKSFELEKELLDMTIQYSVKSSAISSGSTEFRKFECLSMIWDHMKSHYDSLMDVIEFTDTVSIPADYSHQLGDEETKIEFSRVSQNYQEFTPSEFRTSSGCRIISHVNSCFARNGIDKLLIKRSDGKIVLLPYSDEGLIENYIDRFENSKYVFSDKYTKDLETLSYVETKKQAIESLSKLEDYHLLSKEDYFSLTPIKNKKQILSKGKYYLLNMFNEYGLEYDIAIYHGLYSTLHHVFMKNKNSDLKVLVDKDTSVVQSILAELSKTQGIITSEIAVNFGFETRSNMFNSIQTWNDKHKVFNNLEFFRTYLSGRHSEFRIIVI